MIRLECPHCQEILIIPDKFAGQAGTCKHCQNPIAVPKSTNDDPTSEAQAKSKRIPVAIGLLIIGIIAAIVAIPRIINAPEAIEQTATLSEPTKPAPVPQQVAIAADRQIKDAYRLANQGDYKEAIKLFEEVREKNPEVIEAGDGIHFATAYAALDDHAGHEALCRWLFDAFASSMSNHDAARSAKAYLIYPRALDEDLLSNCVILAQYAASVSTDNSRFWNYVDLGMAYVRLKRYDEAIETLNKSVDHRGRKISGLAQAYLALAQHGQGNTAAAHETLERAKNTHAGMQRKGENWRDSMAIQIAINQAEELFGTAQ